MKRFGLFSILIGLLFTSTVKCSEVQQENKQDQQHVEVLNLSQKSVPDLRPSAAADPRGSNSIYSTARSVNLSFFIPAFSLFALASQLMPNMFPNLSTATTSSRHFPQHQEEARGSSSSSPSSDRRRIFRRKNRGGSNRAKKD